MFRPELNSNRSEVVPEKSFVRQMIDNARYYTGAALQGLHNFASNLKEVAGALTSNPLVSAPLKVAGFFVNRVTDIPLVGDLWRIPRALA